MSAGMSAGMSDGIDAGRSADRSTEKCAGPSPSASLLRKRPDRSRGALRGILRQAPVAPPSYLSWRAIHALHCTGGAVDEAQARAAVSRAVGRGSVVRAGAIVQGRLAFALLDLDLGAGGVRGFASRLAQALAPLGAEAAQAVLAEVSAHIRLQQPFQPDPQQGPTSPPRIKANR